MTFLQPSSEFKKMIRKYFCRGFLSMTLLTTAMGFAQLDAYPEGAAELPIITPPSPTVASLMKFEEVPVNNYTGIPNISIPLYSTETYGGFPIDISLSYHPSGVAVNNVASWVGNGWSLNAGGTISRTIHGKPDDVQYGMLSNGFLNPNFVLTDEIKYNSMVFSQYDTEADLFQFNFMGMSGRFYLKRVGAEIKVIPISDDRAYKINVLTEGSFSKITGFEVTDDMGYVYTFLEQEVTTVDPFQLITNRSGSISSPALPSEAPYISSWHLTQIKSPYNKIICTLEYDPVYEHYESVPTRMKYEIDPLDEANVANFFAVNSDASRNIMQPQFITSINSLTTLTKKIKEIEIPNKGTISFNKTNGRQDLLVAQDGSSGAVLSGVTIQNVDGQLIKAYNFLHSYEGDGKRLTLQKINETTGANTLSYELYYNNIGSLPERNSLSTDLWGYFNGQANSSPFNLDPEAGDYFGADRSVDPEKCTTGVLTEIHYPTGGVKKFHFESNTFSYIGNQQATSTTYDVEENRVYHSLSRNHFSGVGTYQTIFIDPSQVTDVTLNVESYTQSSDIGGYRISLLPKVLINSMNDGSGPMIQPQLSDFDPDPSRAKHRITISECDPGYSSLTCTKNVVLEKGWYVIIMEPTDNLAMYNVEFSLDLNYYSLVNNVQYQRGGGLRIKQIDFLDNNQVKKSQNFSYQEFTNPLISSGSLIEYPLFKYKTTRSALYQDGPYSAQIVDFKYLVTTDYNNLNVLKTQGDIGYKNVEVYETGNGKMQFTYTSPRDYPEIGIESYPFVSAQNREYQRGLLTHKKTFKEGGTLLEEELLEYNFSEAIVETGLKIFNPQYTSCGYTDLKNSYSVFVGSVWSCPISSFIHAWDITSVSGWARLIKKETKSYSANAATNSRTVTFSYGNSIHKKITGINETTSSGDEFTKIIQYPQDVINPTAAEIKLVNDHRIALPIFSRWHKSTDIGAPEVKGATKYHYEINSNSHAVLRSEQTSKGSPEIFEHRNFYHKYDLQGNPVEISKANGPSTVLIWGYGHHYPVAKIENSSYNEVHSLIDINSTIWNSDSGIQQAVTTLRNQIPNAMISTFTFDPLVGLTGKTDPNGLIHNYEYDGFGRLEFVRDHNNYIVQEYKYSYKN